MKIKLGLTDNRDLSSNYVAELGYSALNKIADSVETPYFSSDDILRIAVAEGVLPEMGNPYAPRVNPFELRSQCLKMPNPLGIAIGQQMPFLKRLEYGIDWDQLNKTPEVLNYIHNSNTWENTESPDTGFYELARFPVPKNFVGIIRTIQTGLSLDDDTLRWPRGDNLWHRRYDIHCIWHLRIEQYNPLGVDPNTYRGNVATRLTSMPGIEFAPLSSWDTMQFLWGNDHKVFIPVPENSLVSLWIEFTSSNSMANLKWWSGLFKGTFQPQGSNRTYENMTKAW